MNRPIPPEQECGTCGMRFDEHHRIDPLDHSFYDDVATCTTCGRAMDEHATAEVDGDCPRGGANVLRRALRELVEALTADAGPPQSEMMFSARTIGALTEARRALHGGGSGEDLQPK